MLYAFFVSNLLHSLANLKLLFFSTGFDIQEPGFMRAHREKTRKRQAAEAKKVAKKARSDSSSNAAKRQSARLDKAKTIREAPAVIAQLVSIFRF